MAKLVLIGMPGCGKTYWGNLLAQSMNIPFIDLDLEIEQDSGKKIAQLFALHGEQYFRELEQDILLSVMTNLKTNHFVLACGGGTPSYQENMKIINTHGKSIFLDISISTIIKQLLNDEKNNRPLLNSCSEEKLDELLNILRTKRLPHYLQASFKVAEQDVNIDNLKEFYNYE